MNYEKISMHNLGRLSAKEYTATNKNKIVLVLDNIRSLNNVGSAFRTADCFLIEAIYLCGVTGCPPNKEIEKTALGATQTVSWKYFETTIAAVNELKAAGYVLTAVEQATNSVKLNNVIKSSKPFALIFGNEVYGVEQEVIDACDLCLEIPQYGSKHSFNVSVTVGVVLWEMLR